MPLIKRKAIFSVIILAVLGYIFTTAYVEHAAEQTVKRLLRNIKLNTPAILNINYSKLTASPLTLYNNTVSIKNIIIVFKDQPDNPLVIGQLSLISAKIDHNHNLNYLRFAFEDVHFSQKFHYKNLPAALLQYGFFRHLAYYLNGKSPYFYGRFSYNAKNKQVELVNQITLKGANHYRAQERLTNFNFKLPQHPSHLGSLLSEFLHSATKSQLDQYSVKVRIPNFTVPNALRKSLPYYIGRSINNSDFIGQFNLYKNKETNQLIFRKEGKEILRTRIRQTYQVPPLFNYGRPPTLSSNQGQLVQASVSFPPLEKTTTQLTTQQKAQIAKGNKLIKALIPEKNITHYHKALLNLITGQQMIKFEFTPTQKNISAHQLYRLLAQIGRLGLQYPKQPQATLPQLKRVISPWVNDIQIYISPTKQ